jgi:hypothetical protein
VNAAKADVFMKFFCIVAVKVFPSAVDNPFFAPLKQTKTKRRNYCTYPVTILYFCRFNYLQYFAWSGNFPSLEAYLLTSLGKRKKESSSLSLLLLPQFKAEHHVVVVFFFLSKVCSISRFCLNFFKNLRYQNLL